MSNPKLSKKLSWVLRHGAEEVKLQLDANGWADVNDLLLLPQFKKVRREQIFAVVAECPKQRFALKEERGITFIKANQGHTIKNLDLDLKPIECGEAVSSIYHGTYYNVWPKIEKEGLKRMKRVHIHFTSTYPNLNEEFSGIRRSCQIIVEIDVQKLISAGYKLWVSDNNVILCEGNEHGVVPPSFFNRVIDRKTGEDLLKRNIST